MKKLAALLLCTFILMGICACGNTNTAQADEQQLAATGATDATVITEAPTMPALPDTVEVAEGFLFPENTSLLGVDISGLSQAEALTVINQGLSGYHLQIVANGKNISFSAADLDLNCPENALGAYIQALEEGTNPEDIPLISYDSDALRQRLAGRLNSSAKNAAIRYNSSADCFQISEASTGVEADISSIVHAADPVIRALEPGLKITVNEKELQPTITADSEEAKAALAEANSYLNISLTYSYTPDNAQIQYETLTKDNIGSFIAFESDLSPYISSSALRKYVDSMGQKYYVKGNAGQFKTSGGYYINVEVDYDGQPVNTDELYNDLHYALSNGISGTRVAPYLNVVKTEDLAFNGNYVEVNLSAQHLWVYRDGACVVSTPIVSGCAYYRNTTPTGVYSIYNKARNTYLVGANYRSYVNYWMPFKGGYGLHDASWRDTFGDDIYLYDGSHGCVNLPSDIAGNVYENVSVGTKVILYGGATRAEPVTQQMVGTAEYNVPLGVQPFKLDAQPEFGKDKSVTYLSSNPEVAEVAADGTVTVKGVGTTYVTVTAPKHDYYTSAEMIITIKVNIPCPDSEHNFGVPVIVTPATCSAEGLQTVTCTVCGQSEDRTIPVLDHSFGDWTEATAPSCTTEGMRERTCSVCGTPETEAIPSTGHSVSNWNTTDATCTTPGQKTGTCDTCGTPVSEEIPIKSHSFTDGCQFCDYGCGTPNPDYLPPSQDDEEEDSTEPTGDGDATDPTDDGDATDPTDDGGDPDPTDP